MTIPKNSERPIPNRRRLQILELAQVKRAKQVSITERFDPIRFIEHTLPKTTKNFDFDYWEEHPAFLNRPDRKAFVDFTDGIQLYVRPSVVEAAYQGMSEDRFALCHEIGHVILHPKKAVKMLSRHSVGSIHQYQGNPILEYEANLFGGALLAPPDGISPLMRTFEIRRRFQCSQDVAKRAKEDAEFWRKQYD